ncbi:hypothetical protein FHS18_001927 [Paenibacillus phyllosphaerae]|uniref:Uncharacterized protein n=1 Tax=Paenibacillus phyllosphaerae TaxID=274593 RepID=A0A7W5AW11_9BACL|nr:hypothetical protein [Paenibacillus phyllosphaerae]MBB3109864.1 hypothetical protein [Paenibacillus phyllosphaerae]
MSGKSKDRGQKYAENQNFAEEVLEANAKQPAQNAPSESVSRYK